MKRMMWAALMLIGFYCIGSDAHAGWNTCFGCHNGGVAPNKDHLIAKYKTIDALIKGAQATDDPMMIRIKQDIDGLKAAASDLGLNAEKEVK